MLPPIWINTSGFTDISLQGVLGFKYDQGFKLIPAKESLDDLEDWHRSLISRLEKDFNEKLCFMCENKVPEEGVVLRKESLFHCESYKLKSFAFLEAESKELDKGEKNIEDES